MRKSKLEPYREEILKLHKAGISLDRICTWLKEFKGLKAGKTTLYHFLKRRKDSRKKYKYCSMEELDALVSNDNDSHSKKRKYFSQKQTPENTSSSDIDINEILNKHQ